MPGSSQQRRAKMNHPVSLTSRERVNRALNHREGDRIPRMESFWPETIPLWHQQGLPIGTDVADLFGYDMAGAGWIDHQARPGYTEVVQETEEWATRRDGNGTILKFWKHKSGTRSEEHTSELQSQS